MSGATHPAVIFWLYCAALQGDGVCAPCWNVEEACLEQYLLSVANGKQMVDPAYGATTINLTSAIRGIDCVS